MGCVTQGLRGPRLRKRWHVHQPWADTGRPHTRPTPRPLPLRRNPAVFLRDWILLLSAAPALIGRKSKAIPAFVFSLLFIKRHTVSHPDGARMHLIYKNERWGQQAVAGPADARRPAHSLPLWGPGARSPEQQAGAVQASGAAPSD